MSGPLRHWDAPSADAVGRTPEDFLARLDGPTLLQVAGRDRTRTRVVAALLHGNEPSGLRAVHAWVRSGIAPAVDVLCVVGAVEAARTVPPFSHRMLPGERDLNRCFHPPFERRAGAVAEAILAAARSARPEALVDLHNNTGHNPPYAVTTRIDTATLHLTGMFASRAVLSTLRLGALTEVLADELPAVTIECGRAGDTTADGVALAGLTRFVECVRLPSDGTPPAIRVFEEPIRVCVRPGVRLAFGEAAVTSADLTLAPDVDRHNFSRVDAGTLLGWADPEIPAPLEARDGAAHDRAADLFAVADGRMIARRAFVPIMMTTDPRVAIQDCLFYVVRERAAGP